MGVYGVFPHVVAAITGLVVGSFLNVVIWRLPRGANLSKPPSSCPGCGSAIRWFDNVPVLSWMLLRARCRGCKTRISARYPGVELLTGGLFLWAWVAHGDHPVTAAVVAIALAALVAVSFIDWDHKIIPDRISKPGIVFGLVTAPFTLIPDRPGPWFPDFPPALNALAVAAAGALLGAALIYFVRLLGALLFRKEAMGLGDVKLLAFIGALVGPTYVLYVLVLACVLGAVLGGLLCLVGKRRPLPAHVEVRSDAGVATFRRVRIRDDQLWLIGAPEAPTSKKLELDLLLSASKTLTEEDVAFTTMGRLEAVEGEGAKRIWKVALPRLSEEEDELMSIFAGSYRYIPFGPFLSLGGAAVLLHAPWVHWLVVDAYPTWIRGLGS